MPAADSKALAEVVKSTGHSINSVLLMALRKGLPLARQTLCSEQGRVTNVDPLRFNLLFERFLNPERVSMPDIDVDFCFERRGEVIEYVRERYGRSSVGQIITFGTLKARAALRDIARVLRVSPADADRMAKLVPSGPGFSLSPWTAGSRYRRRRRCSY